MKPEDVAKLLSEVSRITDEQWNAIMPERRKRICENVLKRVYERIKSKDGGNTMGST